MSHIVTMTLHKEGRMKQKDHLSNGFSLVEVMIAMVIAAIMFSGIYMVSLQTLNILKMARDESRAIQAAQYEMEKLRSRTWMTLLTMANDTTFNADDNAALAYLNEPSGSVKRTAISPSGLIVDILAVSVTVNWTSFNGDPDTKTLTSIITKRGMLK
jgi:prepilin-type N-terminal cleavage/methylation domain-containing protein